MASARKPYPALLLRHRTYYRTSLRGTGLFSFWESLPAVAMAIHSIISSQEACGFLVFTIFFIKLNHDPIRSRGVGRRSRCRQVSVGNSDQLRYL